MASNVFGAPITNATLKSLPEYSDKTTFTRADRANAALLLKNAQGKDVNARTLVEDLRVKHQDDGTGCLIYNATGDRLTLVAYHDFSGKVAKSPYPVIVENGQWAVFLHGHFGTAACLGVVVYSGKNGAGNKCQWLLGWKQGNGQVSVCYTEIRKGNYYTLETGKDKWDALMPVLTKKDQVVLIETQDNGCKAFAAMGNTNSPLVEGILTLEDEEEEA